MNPEAARKNLMSDDTEVAVAAIRILGTSGNISDLQVLMGRMKHSSPEVRKAAVHSAGRLIRDKLMADYGTLEPAIRDKLVLLLESLDPKVVGEIGKDIYSNDANRRLRAVQILGLLRKNPKTRDILAKLVADRDQKIRATAVNLLGKVIAPNDHNIILSLLNDADKRVRANTIEALESLGNKRVIPVLLRYKNDPSNRIRGNVLKALHSLGRTDIQPGVLDMLNAKDDLMKASALWVITQTKLDGKQIEDAAGHCLLGDNPIVLDNARKALKALSSQRALGYLEYLSLNPGFAINSRHSA